ncbi:rhombosortase [Pseudoalteromonas sp. MMG010]|uniref:rhombosortase n=1 Tax=Pseudoalteromonas sp. MMG010 TaxID=2822685 RepID=UPI001B39F105|nr:rhombosortase [Pseudoalteromonas sp. MMG010]MBQ4832435.1 rhombosortase [Pseudoalteromonas sp. MMG010]
MFNLPLQYRYSCPPLTLLLISFVFAAFDLNSILEFNRNNINNGELWRIFTSQFVHANWMHYFLNSTGVILIWLLHGEYTSPKRYCFNITSLALWCGLGVYWLCPDISIYTGLSALLHGVIVWGAIKDIQLGLKSGILLFIGIWLKIAHEQINGPSSDIAKMIDSTVAIDAHLIGAVGGVVLATPILIALIKKLNAKI